MVEALSEATEKESLIDQETSNQVSIKITHIINRIRAKILSTSGKQKETTTTDEDSRQPEQSRMT